MNFNIRDFQIKTNFQKQTNNVSNICVSPNRNLACTSLSSQHTVNSLHLGSDIFTVLCITFKIFLRKYVSEF